jgi:hypothetical protein
LEKMLYVVWKNEADSDERFRRRLLEELSPQLVALGARRLRIGVVDEDVIPAAPLRTETTRPPISGLVSIWVDTSVRRRPMEDAIQASVSRLAGYLVTESEPIVNTKHVVPEGGRTPGMYQVVLLRRPPRLSHERWLDIWLGSHTQVAIDTQSTFGYRQNVVVRPLTYVAPAYDAIVEELFPAEAMTDPMVFYNAAGDEVRRKRHEKAMLESVVRFIDFDKMDRIPMSEYIMKS